MRNSEAVFKWEAQWQQETLLNSAGNLGQCLLFVFWRTSLTALDATSLDQADTGNPVFTNDFVSVKESGPDGSIAVTVGSGRGAVALVNHNDKVLLIQQPRYATGSLEWELPRSGSLDDETPLETADRCVEAWTGVQVDSARSQFLGVMSPDPEILTNEVSIYLLEARNSTVRTNRERVRWVDTEELVRSCLSGETEDSFTCTAVLRARIKGLI